ncbi:MAG: V-type ATP synthase subunit F [Porcipelethomonas sp.]
MKFYLISDNIDTQMGMRLAGIKGAVVHEPDEVRQELEKALADRDTAVILMTEKLVRLCDELVYDIKLNRKSPLIVEIPDRHGTSQITENISRYVSEAIGLKM